MQLLIDRQTRDALHDACREDIEFVSDIKIDTPRGAELARYLGHRLRPVTPLLDQIGWEQDTDREVFDVDLNVRRIAPFLRRHIRGVANVFETSVVTESQMNESLATAERYGWVWSDEQRAEELAALRAQVDADLDLLATYKRLLEALEPHAAAVEIEAVA